MKNSYSKSLRGNKETKVLEKFCFRKKLFRLRILVFLNSYSFIKHMLVIKKDVSHINFVV
jgi:hypothetical protein